MRSLRVRLLITVSLSLSFVACAPTATPTPPASSSAPTAPLDPTLQAIVDAFPVPRVALRIPAEGRTLQELLSEVSAATGVTYSHKGVAVGGALQTVRAKLSQETVVQPADVYPWLESLLLENGLRLTCDVSVRPTLVHVRSAEGFDMQDPATVQVEWSPQARELVRRHPALHFTTRVDLPNVDVRTLNATLRPMMPNESGSGVMPAANTQAVVVRGAGRTVAQLVELLEGIDVQAARAKSASAVKSEAR